MHSMPVRGSCEFCGGSNDPEIRYGMGWVLLIAPGTYRGAFRAGPRLRICNRCAIDLAVVLDGVNARWGERRKDESGNIE